MWLRNKLLPSKSIVKISEKLAGGFSRLKKVVAAAALEDYGPLPGFCVPHSKLKPSSGDVRQFLTAYATSGGPHHNAVLFGDARTRLRFAARLLGADYCEV